MVALNYAEVGVEYIVKKVTGNVATKNHLLSLGFRAGEKVTVINKLNGDLIVNLKETKIAISGKIAESVLI